MPCLSMEEVARGSPSHQRLLQRTGMARGLPRVAQQELLVLEDCTHWVRHLLSWSCSNGDFLPAASRHLPSASFSKRPSDEEREHWSWTSTLGPDPCCCLDFKAASGHRAAVSGSPTPSIQHSSTEVLLMCIFTTSQSSVWPELVIKGPWVGKTL